jgi:hypothetical protein
MISKTRSTMVPAIKIKLRKDIITPFVFPPGQFPPAFLEGEGIDTHARFWISTSCRLCVEELVMIGSCGGCHIYHHHPAQGHDRGMTASYDGDASSHIRAPPHRRMRVPIIQQLEPKCPLPRGANVIHT